MGDTTFPMAPLVSLHPHHRECSSEVIHLLQWMLIGNPRIQTQSQNKSVVCLWGQAFPSMWQAEGSPPPGGLVPTPRTCECIYSILQM